ncbi:hypothetical protein MTR72_24345 [Bradyrhizobium sp. ISRA442]|uniref:hypothetical protein n=1 Tax=Bradyrhizobium sp. ISRA442 TaxID=2866197 RepID=UPI00311ACCF2
MGAVVHFRRPAGRSNPQLDVQKEDRFLAGTLSTLSKEQLGVAIGHLETALAHAEDLRGRLKPGPAKDDFELKLATLIGKLDRLRQQVRELYSS